MKYSNILVKMKGITVKPQELVILKDIIKASREVYKKGLTIGKSGNVSGRIRDNIIIIKKTGRSMEKLKPKDFVLVDISKNEIPRNVSSDYDIHREIYLNNPSVRYVIHAHPAKLVKLTFSIKEEEISPETYEGRVYFGDKIPIVREEHKNLHKVVKKYFNRKFLIEAGHGIYVFSDDLDEILFILEELEYLASLLL